MPLEIAGLTHIGIVRAGRPNEDALFVPDDGTAAVVGFAVADGVGGAPGGARASTAAVSAFATIEAGDDPSSALLAAVEAASAAVGTVAVDAPELTGAATTIVFAFAAAERVWIANIGDSRGYHWHDGALQQVTVDHSWVQQEIDAGRMAARDARSHPRRNLITRALNTHRDEDPPDRFEVALAPGDRVLLCTDGLTGPLDDDAIAALLAPDSSAAELASQPHGGSAVRTRGEPVRPTPIRRSGPRSCQAPGPRRRGRRR